MKNIEQKIASLRIGKHRIVKKNRHRTPLLATARTASRLSTRTGRRSTRTEICFTQAALSAPSAFDPLRRASSLSSRVASTASTTFRFSIFRRRQNCFQVLFAPCCAKCSEFIIGRVLKVKKIRYYQSSRRKKISPIRLPILNYTKSSPSCNHVQSNTE